MVGITLTPDQIRIAPPDVRRWREQELATSLGLRPRQPSSEQRHEHLVACSGEQAIAILRQIQGMLPVVNVFFEFGRPGASLPDKGLEAFRLLDVVNHTRLQNVGQVMACLRLINQALHNVSGDANATLYAVDQHGDCFIAAQTQQSILQVWLQVVAGQVLHGAAQPNEKGTSTGIPAVTGDGLSARPRKGAGQAPAN